jgi:DNA-directed RNA polymerase specialized sigma24 family protein
MKQASLLGTRRSLIERLADWGDQVRWQEFFDTYSKLIYSAARRSGLTDSEAQEVVHETVITVAKSIDKSKYDPAIGSFKAWLLQITRWRIADQFRKRERGDAKRPPLSDGGQRQQSSVSLIHAALIWTRSGKPSGRRICLRQRSRA